MTSSIAEAMVGSPGAVRGGAVDEKEKVARTINCFFPRDLSFEE